MSPRAKFVIQRLEVMLFLILKHAPDTRRCGIHNHIAQSVAVWIAYQQLIVYTKMNTAHRLRGRKAFRALMIQNG
ncbi:hypothetical protein D3C86_2176170 [compost metagenome]